MKRKNQAIYDVRLKGDRVIYLVGVSRAGYELGDNREEELFLWNLRFADVNMTNTRPLSEQPLSEHFVRANYRPDSWDHCNIKRKQIIELVEFPIRKSLISRILSGIV